MIIKEYYAPAFLGDRMLIHMISDDLQLSSDKKGELIQDYYKNNESKLLKWAKLIKKKCPRFFDDFIEIADLEDSINENIKKGKSKMIVKEEIHFDESAKRNRKLKEAESYGWIVETNQVWEAYDLACDNYGQEAVDRAIVDTLSDDELASSLAYLFRMWDFREWDEYLEGNEDEDEFED